MPIDILMPALSPTMTEGKLAKWLKKEGDRIKSGDVLAEIETDKATMEVEAVDEGTLGKILVAAGAEGVAVNTRIAIILEEGEEDAALAATPKPVASPAAAPSAAAPSPAAAAAPVAGTAAAAHQQGDRIFISPLARRMAEQAGLSLAAVTGSGPHGRIVKADIEAALAKGVVTPATAAKPTASVAPQAAPAAAVPAAAKGVDAKALADKLGMKYKVLPNSGMRKTIAKRLTEAWQTIPHFGLTVDCEIDSLLRLRAELNEKSGEKISVNDFVVKAVAIALAKFPAANVSWHEDGILQYETVDVSVAVSTDGGLITPIVKNADRKGLATISAEVKELAKKAKEGKLKPEEFQGGTFSVSNLGMFGIKAFTSIINPPQSCILSVGAGEKRPVVRGDALAVATVMTLTLTVDHRSVDGAVGAAYLKLLKGLIEDPITLML
jgi:pyruvate dehydrogenase E2 component (dihydrolipoamide acetyltransferase)